VTRKKRLRKEVRRLAAGKPAKRPGHLFGKEVVAAVETLAARGIVEFDGQAVALTEEGMTLGAARRAAREAGLDPDEVAPV
jgi:hypothetical protein